MMNLKAWAGLAVMALAAGCAPGGGGGGGTGTDERPLVIEVDGFDRWFEIREDGAWPKCPDDMAPSIYEDAASISRYCGESEEAGVSHVVVTLKSTGVVTAWRYDIEPMQHWVHVRGDDGGAARFVQEIVVSEAGKTCDAVCFVGQCADLDESCR